MFLWRDVDDLLNSPPCEEVAVWVLALFCVGAGAHGLREPTSHKLSTFVGAGEGQFSSGELLGM